MSRISIARGAAIANRLEIFSAGECSTPTLVAACFWRQSRQFRRQFLRSSDPRCKKELICVLIELNHSQLSRKVSSQINLERLHVPA